MSNECWTYEYGTRAALQAVAVAMQRRMDRLCIPNLQVPRELWTPQDAAIVHHLVDMACYDAAFNLRALAKENELRRQLRENAQ